MQERRPICSSRKQVRNDDYWEQLEGYIGARSPARFSHGVCPDCRRTVAEGQLTEGRKGH